MQRLLNRIEEEVETPGSSKYKNVYRIKDS